MHPISKTNFGVEGIRVRYYNGTSVVNGYIVKQVGTDTFLVTDGSNPFVRTLAQTTGVASDIASNPTYFTILLHPTIASSATFTATYEVHGATSAIASGGTGYTVADVLTLTGTGSATATVATVDGGGTILTFTLSAVGSGVTALPSNPRPTTGGTGTGATFNLKYRLKSVAVTGGTGFFGNEPLVFTGMTAVSTPTAHVSAATDGVPTAVTVDTQGTGVSVAATSISVSTVDQHVQHIYSNKVVTTEGNSLKWTLGSSVNGSAYFTPYS